MTRHISSLSSPNQSRMMVSISTLEKIAQQLKALSSIDVIVHELSIDNIRVHV